MGSYAGDGEKRRMADNGRQVGGLSAVGGYHGGNAPRGKRMTVTDYGAAYETTQQLLSSPQRAFRPPCAAQSAPRETLPPAGTGGPAVCARTTSALPPPPRTRAAHCQTLSLQRPLQSDLVALRFRRGRVP
ncbi:hypothetical protein FGB62_22g824 [Gracilaria domingensis]|nr:hypothetical protein FGB62_22g824 [Gracilaria domingensis]